MAFFLLFSLTKSKSLYATLHEDTDEKPYFIMFTSKTCPHCKTAAPIFEKTAKALQDIAESIKVDVGRERRLAGELHITSVPSFVCFYKGVPTKYNGYPNEKQMFIFVVEQLGKNIQTATTSLKDSKDNMVVYFTKRFKPTSTLSYASYSLSKSSLKFIMVNKQQLIKDMGITKVPSYYFFKNGEMQQYHGSTDPLIFTRAVREFYNIPLDVQKSSDETVNQEL